jgi:hypothetical protein
LGSDAPPPQAPHPARASAPPLFLLPRAALPCRHAGPGPTRPGGAGASGVMTGDVDTASAARAEDVAAGGVGAAPPSSEAVHTRGASDLVRVPSAIDVVTTIDSPTRVGRSATTSTPATAFEVSGAEFTPPRSASATFIPVRGGSSSGGGGGGVGGSASASGGRSERAAPATPDAPRGLDACGALTIVPFVPSELVTDPSASGRARAVVSIHCISDRVIVRHASGE